MTMQTDPSATHDLATAARTVAELASGHMHRAEDEGRLTGEVWQALVDAGLPRIWIPRSLGGEELGVITVSYTHLTLPTTPYV